MAVASRNRNGDVVGIRLVLGYLCVFLAFFGGITLLPLLSIAIFQDEWRCFLAFVIPGGASLAIGMILGPILMKGRAKGKLEKFQDSVLLVAIWLLCVLIGSMPFFLADKVDFFGGNEGALSMNFSEAFFESMSGYSACGFTVLHGFLPDGTVAYSSFFDAQIGYCPHVFLFYRAVTQFFGGVGLVLVVASAVSDRFGMQLFNTEGHNDRLLPNLAKTAKATFGIYTGIILLGTLSMWLFGMNWFEALCHSIAGMATGGFSTRTTGFYNYTNPTPIFGTINSVGIEITIDIIMLLGATSFLLIYYALTAKWKKAFRDCELRLTGFLLVVSILAGFYFVSTQFIPDYGVKTIDWKMALRYSSFQMISCLTTTGFSNAASIVQLGQGVIFLSIILMFVGGGMGSTAGAIKQFRVVIALKSLWWSIRYKFSPSRLTYPHNIVRAGAYVEVTDEMHRDNTLYMVLYFVVIAAVSFVMCFLRLSPASTFSATESVYLVASSLSGTGNTIVDFLSIRQTFMAVGGDGIWNYYVVLWVMSLCMILGRLEILPIYYALRRINRLLLRRQVS